MRKILLTGAQGQVCWELARTLADTFRARYRRARELAEQAGMP